MSKIIRSRLGYLRRGLILGLTLVAVVALLLGGYGWKVYHRNLSVSDANLRPLPALTATDRILVLSPHPDDETLGAGGLMAQARELGIPVRVVFMTNGDGSLSTRLVRDAHLLEQIVKGKIPKRSKNIYRDLAPIRQTEATAALNKLGIAASDITFLGYPDGGTRSMWETHWELSNPYRSPYTKTDHSPYANSWTPHAPYSGAQAVADVKQILIDFKPTLVLTTNPHDTHPDHWAAYAYLNAALSQLQLNPKNFSWSGHVRCYTFLIHHGLWPVPHGYHPEEELAPPAALMQSGVLWWSLPLEQKLQTHKTEALNCYRSQLATTPQFLRGFLRKNEIFGAGMPVTISPAQWDTVINDPVQDLLLPEIVSAGDITDVQLNADPKVLSVKLNLDGEVWKELQYIITMHRIDAQKITVERIKIQPDRNKKLASLTTITKGATRQQNIGIAITDRQVIAHIPVEKTAQNLDAKDTLLISASSVFRGKILDITPTQKVILNR